MEAEIGKCLFSPLLASGLLVCHWPKAVMRPYLESVWEGHPGEGHREAVKVRASDANSLLRASSWLCHLPALGTEAQDSKLPISQPLHLSNRAETR